MTESDDQPKSTRRPSGIGPGERLQAARIQQGLSLDDVANRMHLSIKILEAIEENNFDEVTAPIFVKGYLRAYARIVALDEDEMIQQYAEFYSGEDPPIGSTSNTIPELSAGDARIKWTTYLVILVLAALLAAWWWNKQQSVDVPISLDAQQSETVEAQAAARSEVASEIEAVSERLDTEALSQSDALSREDEVESPTLAEPTFETVPEASTAAAPEPAASETAAPETAAPETAAPETDEPVAAIAEREPAADESTSGGDSDVEVRDAAAEGSLVVAQIAPTGTDKLRVVVHADSWIDIKDATGFQLTYDLLRAGELIELVGEAPFSVFLGNGHGVELQFNGEDFDLAARIRDDNTARLKIGP